MKVISVINFKGGVGKTTLTANLGAYAASAGKRVLLIDLDPQTHLTLSFMTRDVWNKCYAKDKTMLKFFEAVRLRSDIPSLSSLVIPVNIDSLKIDLLSSHVELMDSDVKLAAILTGSDDVTLASGYMYGVSCLREALSKLQKNYDLVLIDCPPNFSVTVKSAIYASDYYVVPAKLDHFSLIGIEALTKMLAEYRQECNKHVNKLRMKKYSLLTLDMLGVIPMMVDVWGGKPQKVPSEFLEYLRQHYYVFQYIERDNEMFSKQLVNRRGNVVPTVLAHFKADKARLKGELRLLCEDFLNKLKLGGKNK